MASLFGIPIEKIRGVGPRRAELFQKLGVASAGALLRYYPRAYEDWRCATPIGALPPDGEGVILAEVVRAPQERRIRKGMSICRFVVTDESGEAEVTLFNAHYAPATFRAETRFWFRGKFMGSGARRTVSAPEFLPEAQGGAVRAVYPQTEGLSSRVIAAAVAQALALLPSAVRDPLPDDLRAARGLMGLGDALRAIHQPPSAEAAAAARKRLAYEELLTLQLGLLRLRARDRAATAVRLTEDRSAEFFARLPFAATGAQRRAVAEAMADLMRGVPMNRLVQGDVGSGKTAVAAALCWCMARSGYQCALMAPTGILAEQHMHTLTGLFAGSGIRCALLTGACAPAEKRRVQQAIAAGEIDVAVGTHALISEAVQFCRLGLVITDEQHRFGVAQRAALAEKGMHPHLLVMSATPIPRTLALILYGDLDVSVLDELPPGRTPVKTALIGSARRARAFEFIRRELDAGRQAYVVCSLVEPGDDSPDDRKAAVDYCAQLQSEALRGYRVELLHGRMKPQDKEAVMARFASGETQVLVATTVIEVGVDVPNASVLLVENAERFGLSQLHQLRGRVGRGCTQSYCILVSDSKNPDTRRRLTIMTETTDGFRIADEDLKLRGPGDFFGARQHGLPALQTASLADMELLAQAQHDAVGLLRADPELAAPELRLLRAGVARLFGAMGEQSLN